ncbi:MAG: hypothetical protein R3Y27_09045, partial [Clostridia bacterium]
CFSFFPEKKKMPFFWLLFLGKQKNVTPLRQQKLHQPHQQTKKQSEIYPQQQTQERQKNQPLRKRKNDNIKPKPLHNQRNCKNEKQGGVEPLPYGYKNISQHI